jgi:hypothetical protein
MKTSLRKSAERGHADHGWLDTHHTFSFGDYNDPRFQEFSALRVMNEDVVTGGGGFPLHPHRDMEIVTYMVEGAVRHADSMGNSGVIAADKGDVQAMSAGTGLRHSEENASADASSHFLQIWLYPRKNGSKPRYDQKGFPRAERRNRLQPLVSPDGRDGSLQIDQDAVMLGGLLDAGKEAVYPLAPNRRAWVQLIAGRLQVGDQTLDAGDGLALAEADNLALKSEGDKEAEFLLFDLP